MTNGLINFEGIREYTRLECAKYHLRSLGARHAVLRQFDFFSEILSFVISVIVDFVFEDRGLVLVVSLQDHCLNILFF